MEKENNKEIIILLIVIIVILAVLCILFATGTISFKSNEINEENVNNNSNKNNSVNESDDEKDIDNEKDIINTYLLGKDGQNSTYLNTNDVIEFYKDDELINSYKCNGKKCDILPFQTEVIFENGVYTNKRQIIGDYILIAVCDTDSCSDISTYGGTYFEKQDSETASGNVLLYNIKSGIVKTYNNVSKVLYASEKLNLINYSNDSYTIVSYDGKLNSKFDANELILSCYEGCYLNNSSFDYDNNIIVTKNNNKFGIKNLTTGELIVDYKYDNITLTNNGFPYSYYNKNYFIGQINGKNNIYKINDNNNITNKGYDQIYFLDKNTLLVFNDNQFSFIDLNENKIIDDTIKVNNLYPIYPKNPNGIRISKTNPETYKEETDIIYMAICEGDINNYYYHSYSYNLKTKKLIFIK